MELKEISKKIISTSGREKVHFF